MNDASQIPVGIVPQTGGMGVIDRRTTFPDASDGKNLEGTDSGPLQPEIAVQVNSNGFATPSVAELGASGIPSVSTEPRPKGAKNPHTDRRMKHGRNVRWLHISKTPDPERVRAPILHENGSEEHKAYVRKLTERLKEEGYRVADLPPDKPAPIKKIKGVTYRRPPMVIPTAAKEKT